MAKCFMCKGDMVLQHTSYMVDFGDCIVIVKNVPTLVCEQCGEKAYTDEVAAVLETIVTRAREMLTEIAVVNYPEKAA
nr:MAG TPA: MqsA [Caudoviricetes sp.]